MTGQDKAACPVPCATCGGRGQQLVESTYAEADVWKLCPDCYPALSQARPGYFGGVRDPLDLD